MIMKGISRAITVQEIMAAAITVEETRELTGVKMKTSGTTATNATNKIGAATKDVAEWAVTAAMKTGATETLKEAVMVLHLVMAPILALEINMETLAASLVIQDAQTGEMMKEDRMKETGKVARE